MRSLDGAKKELNFISTLKLEPNYSLAIFFALTELLFALKEA
jgi:hypothetical protein